MSTPDMAICRGSFGSPTSVPSVILVHLMYSSGTCVMSGLWVDITLLFVAKVTTCWVPVAPLLAAVAAGARRVVLRVGVVLAGGLY